MISPFLGVYKGQSDIRLEETKKEHGMVKIRALCDIYKCYFLKIHQEENDLENSHLTSRQMTKRKRDCSNGTTFSPAVPMTNRPLLLS